MECPKSGSSCPFGEFGCTYKGGRENLQTHIKTDSVSHLSFLCDGISELKVFLKKLILLLSYYLKMFN